jgi:hypothetical protein
MATWSLGWNFLPPTHGPLDWTGGDIREMLAEIEYFIEGFNQPTYRGRRINGQRVATWSSQHGWSGM